MKPRYIKRSVYWIVVLSFHLAVTAQNETSKWYFGLNCGLDFMTSSPTSLSNGMVYTTSSSSSISDVAGNLLFYSDNKKIWNKLHAPLMNGTLTGDAFGYRYSPLIIKKPGNSTLYYIFNIIRDSSNLSNRLLRYSVVDMTMDSGLGAVISKNTLIYNNSTEKITAIKHCNNSDIWIISQDFNSNNFRANLLTAAGLSTLTVFSPVAATYTDYTCYSGTLKASPNGNKIGNFVWRLNSSNSYFEVFDFDRASGIISNELNLGLGLGLGGSGCDFSPDGSKFYGGLYQWDLCAGSPSAIVNSVYTITSAASGIPQLALDGRIYITTPGTKSISIINNPNLAGAACNYSNNVLSVATGTCGVQFPTLASFFLQPSFTFTSGLSCQTASFTVPPASSGCAAAGTPTLGSLLWLFGDPSSGSANTSTLNNPVHTYPAPGSYTVKLVLDYNACVADTQVKVVQTPGLPVLNVSGNFTLCPTLQATLTATGANTYTWSNALTSASVVLNPSVTTTYTVSGTFTNSGCASTKIVSIVRASCVGITEIDNSTALIKIYPNPVQNILILEAQKPVQIFIYNQLGLLMTEALLQQGINYLDMSNFKNGVYLLQTKTGERILSHKIVKVD